MSIVTLCRTTASLAKNAGGAPKPSSSSSSSLADVGTGPSPVVAPEVPDHHHRMQPTAPASTGGGDMDLPTVQSMDWVFQNKQLYFLAQYLAQVSPEVCRAVTSLTLTP